MILFDDLSQEKKVEERPTDPSIPRKMAPRSKEEKMKTPYSSQPTFPADDDDDDFQDPSHSLPLTQTTPLVRGSIKYSNHSPKKNPSSSLQPLKPSNNRPSKKSKQQQSINAGGKENLRIGAPLLPSNIQPPPHFQKPSKPRSSDSRTETAGGRPVRDDDSPYNYASSKQSTRHHQVFVPPPELLCCSLDSIESAIDCSYREDSGRHQAGIRYSGDYASAGTDTTSTTTTTTTTATTTTEEMALKLKAGSNYLSNSIESRLVNSRVNCGLGVRGNDGNSDKNKHYEEFEPGPQLDVLLKLCSEVDEQDNNSITADLIEHGREYGFDDGLIPCPLCGVDISYLSDELRHVHTNECLDKEETLNEVVLPDNATGLQCPGQVLHGSPIRSPQQGVDVSPVLQWLCSLGLARYDDVFVREEIDWDSLQWLTEEDLFNIGVTALGPRKKILHALSELRKEGTKAVEIHADASKVVGDETCKLAVNKLITDYFPGSVADRRKGCTTSRGRNDFEKCCSNSGRKRVVVKARVLNGKPKDIPLWCCIPGTPFRVDAFKYLRRDCFHWFLTHFHIDHYQGLTRSFCHGTIYCSLITARLVNLKIGIPWDKLQVLPLNQKISIAGIDVTCFDANHCPGSIIILFEPPSDKAILHTGDFRFGEEMAKISILQTCPVHTLILDTTYCDPQYDFPKQEAVIQFVIEAIQAEAFNPKTLFLIGSYTIGKERLFVEVARVLRMKVYVTAAKLRLLECLGFPKEDMQWFTLNELESHIHVVPMWTLASFKRLKHISNQYMGRFSLIVAFSPTGWTFGKGKKKSPGRRWQQGTIIRYEVPYSEHCSFTELRDFVKFISPVNIIPSVNNHGPESTSMMVSLLSS